MISILIADDHEVVRRGVRALLEAEPDMQICAEAANGRDAVHKAAKHKPDVAVIDIAMPELNGLDAARQIRLATPTCEVLILTMHASEEMAREALAAGARGFLLKSDAGHDLIAAVHSLHHHRPFLTPSVATMVLEGYLGGTPQSPPADRSGTRLTTREREVVQLLAEGKNNIEVAAALGVSVRTIETHRANIMRKLDLHSMNELVRYAVRNKILEA